jgi:hypothetical protein
MYDNFAQVRPRQRCRYQREFMALSLMNGYKCKCNRDPRCSVECLANWSRKERCVTAHFLESTEWVPQFAKSAGNLFLPKDASVSDHKMCRAAFIRKMAACCRKEKVVIRFRCISHITDIDQMHYDFTMYSNMSMRKLKDIVAKTWLESGGLRSSLMPVRNVTAWSIYVAKAMKESRFIPEKNGLRYTWGSGKFWSGSTHDKVTREDVWRSFRNTFPKTMLATYVSNRKTIDELWESECGSVTSKTYLSTDAFNGWVEDFVSKYPGFATIEIVPQPKTYTQDDYDRELKEYLS